MSTSVCLLDEPFTSVVDLDMLRRLDGLYAFYHKYWWCRRQMFGYYKLCNAILNGLALLTAAASIVVGSVWKDGYVAVGLTALATVLKGWNELKKYSLKMDMTQFAYTTYEKTLTELRNYALGGVEELDGFLIKTQTLDDVVTDFTPPTYDRYLRDYETRFVHAPL